MRLYSLRRLSLDLGSETAHPLRHARELRLSELRLRFHERLARRRIVEGRDRSQFWFAKSLTQKPIIARVA